MIHRSCYPYTQTPARSTFTCWLSQGYNRLVRSGVVRCLEGLGLPKTSNGPELLVSKGLYELSGEYIIVKYRSRFSREAVASASGKLRDLGYSPPEAPTR